MKRKKEEKLTLRFGHVAGVRLKNVRISIVYYEIVHIIYKVRTYFICGTSKTVPGLRNR